MRISLRVPGSTANLGPGYDVLGLSLSIYNRIQVRTSESPGTQISVRGEGEGTLPSNQSNLFYKAASFTAEKAGEHLPGLQIEMENEIPLARGLGSSSTAIVGGVAAAGKILGDPFSQAELLDIAAEIEGHPDNVSPCLMGGLTVSSLDGGHVHCIQAVPPPELKAIVAIPSFELDTQAARSALPTQISHEDAIFNVGRACLVTAALIQGNLDILRVAMRDRLHQPFRAPLVPGFDNVVRAAEEAGALGACLSGAGPTILALATENDEEIRNAMIEAWSESHVEAVGRVLEVDSDGVVFK